MENYIKVSTIMLTQGNITDITINNEETIVEAITKSEILNESNLRQIFNIGAWLLIIHCIIVLLFCFRSFTSTVSSSVVVQSDLESSSNSPSYDLTGNQIRQPPSNY
ncbi:hypothetical protein D8M04_09085 [Oceanobacillus piezotolerans]|uniref:Uncharacterized protein n=1 Tax=Oceanobacillus piezotolerans TaxID=2448030 RepID=A0A498D844_9BACI|nr:hypothetical protein [Oceanobacillus piezotolerans]RLL45017.1 hypothetical protein D8M04_09085 [Oceanobacillus piezotolerans]